MNYCKNCGNRLEEGSSFCTVCGKPAAQPVQGGPEESPDTKNADAERLFAILSYFGLLVFIPLFLSQKSRFVRFHVNQGLILFLAEIILGISGAVLHAVLFAFSWRLIFLASSLNLVWIPLTVLSVMGIINAAQGEYKALPLIGKLRLLSDIPA